MTISSKTIGNNIRRARLAQQLTQQQTAEKLSISPLYYDRVERGERPVSLEQLAQIAKLLSVPIGALLNGCMVHKPLRSTTAGQPNP